MYAESDTCLLIAEADRVLCHLVMFLPVFLYLRFCALDLQNEIQLLSTTYLTR